MNYRDTVLIKEYNKLNSSFNKKLIYNLGSEAGFFSEYNNMILAMLYCLKHKIQFKLYSKDATFKYDIGWQDYFLSFCAESNDLRHSIYNYRQPILDLSLHRKISRFFFKLITNTNYLTADLWNEFHNKNLENEYFYFPELGINGNIHEACKQLINLTWRYNTQTEKLVNESIINLNLPQLYLGFHIRGGDKFKEYKKIDIEKYIEKAEQVSDLTDVFVATDDYQNVKELNSRYSKWNFFTLTEENENGYIHEDFIVLDKEVKKRNIIKLISSIDILSNSQHFIGTYSSNPGMYLGMRMKKENVHGVDLDKWTIW